MLLEEIGGFNGDVRFLLGGWKGWFEQGLPSEQLAADAEQPGAAQGVAAAADAKEKKGGSGDPPPPLE